MENKRIISMKCNQKQFDSVKPKLEKSGIEIFMITDFRDNFYLAYFLGQGVTNGTNHLESEGDVYEEWSEKVFLEACGIFEEPKFEITKEQVLELSEKFGSHNSSLSKSFLTEHLKRMFPEVFETEPKHGEYWFHSTGKLVFIEETTNLKTVKCRHIDNEKNLAFHGVDCMDRQATSEEVTEALNKEAVKRYKVGDYLKNHQGVWKLEDFDIVYSKKYNEGIYNRQGSGKWLCINGIWAEIIPTKTIQEAEQLLKELGHNFKIV